MASPSYTEETEAWEVSVTCPGSPLGKGVEPESKPRGLTLEPEPPTTVLTAAWGREEAIIDSVWWASTTGKSYGGQEGMTQLCFGIIAPEATWRMC